MTSAIPTAPSRARRWRLGVAAAAGALLVTSMAMPTAHAWADLGLPDNCTLVDQHGTTYVECGITDSGTITVDDLVPPGLTPHDGTSVVLTARGGAGATLAGDTGGRAGGSGGVARTSAAAHDIDQLHVYVGQDAATRSQSGGSATIVSDIAIEDVTSIEDTWLVAGGGGAQGSWMYCGTTWGGGETFAGAGSGGDGGFAEANHRSSGHDATGHGADGGTGSRNGCPDRKWGHPGTGGDLGVAGTNHGDSRSNGVDGVGGHGGGNGWQGNLAPGYEPGSGGTTSVWAQGGGGWGGGAGGERNGGGGGGGSYARAASEWVDVPRDYPSTPSVTLAWPLDPPAH